MEKILFFDRTDLGKDLFTIQTVLLAMSTCFPRSSLSLHWYHTNDFFVSFVIIVF